MIIKKQGNIFSSQCQTIVNTVNCVGVMGAGIALAFKLRYPDMYCKYEKICQEKKLTLGKLWRYKDPQAIYGFEQVLSFPTKQHWKDPSQLDGIKQGLEKFVNTYKQCGITSIAFPILGAGKGGLSEAEVLPIMEQYLSNCDITIEIWQFSASAEDDLYSKLTHLFLNKQAAEIKQETGLSIRVIEKIQNALTQPEINSISALSSAQGIGKVTIEKIYALCKPNNDVSQHTLF